MARRSLLGGVGAVVRELGGVGSLLISTPVVLLAGLIVSSRGRGRGSPPPAGGGGETSAELAPWERAAVLGPAVGLGHDHGVDEAPVGSGQPSDQCGPALGLGASEQPWTCPTDPVADPRWAPVPRGAPFAKRPSSSTWPVITKDSRRLVTSYWTKDGPLGASGRAFATKRDDPDGEREHAGIDLYGDCDDPVVVPEDGRILGFYKFNQGTWACYVRAASNDQVICLGEIEAFSWRQYRNPLGLALGPGVSVLEGQPIGRIGRQGETCMLHVEIYDGAGISDEAILELIRGGHFRWPASTDAPARLLDGSAYWLNAATEQYRREVVFG